jgi:hypothetical protein
MNVLMDYPAAHAFNGIAKAIVQKPADCLRTADTRLAMYVKIFSKVFLYKTIDKPRLVVVDALITVLAIVAHIPEVDVQDIVRVFETVAVFRERLPYGNNSPVARYVPVVYAVFRHELVETVS